MRKYQVVVTYGSSMSFIMGPGSESKQAAIDYAATEFLRRKRQWKRGAKPSVRVVKVVKSYAS